MEKDKIKNSWNKSYFFDKINTINEPLRQKKREDPN